MKKIIESRLAYAIALAVLPFALMSQCVNSFPLLEDFEISNGGWVSGGTANDWVWGTPSKPTIFSAGGGDKCWIVGGLTGSMYSLSARSYVQSPCYDFSSLANPIVEFKVFWETERQYDGATFQYSTDNGNTWTNLGGITSNQSCAGENWFNAPSVNFLSSLASPREGWSGNIQPGSGSCLSGQGSARWLTAHHCLSSITNRSNVKFRFAFGAGSTCNNYDGFAFDDFSIREAYPFNANFEFECRGGEFSFADITTTCVNRWSWDFGEPNSGAANTSTLQNPTHTYTSPGRYFASLTTWTACGNSSTIRYPVNVLSAEVSVTDVSCLGGNDGGANVSATAGAVSYIWGTSPPQSGFVATGLSAGVYTVTVSGGSPEVCPVVIPFTISEIPSLQANLVSSPDYCNGQTGTVEAYISGGAAPYHYLWSNASTDAFVFDLPAGPIDLLVTDANGCTVSFMVNVDAENMVAVSIIEHQPLCFGDASGMLRADVLGGTNLFYLWSNTGETSQSISGLTSGTYAVTVTDVSGCSGTAAATLVEPPPLQVSISQLPVNCGQQTVIGISIDNLSGGTPSYDFSTDGQTFIRNIAQGTTIPNLHAGSYNFVVRDQNGCESRLPLTLVLPAITLVDAGLDSVIWLGDSLVLQGSISNPPNPLRVRWNPSAGLSCDTCLNPIAKPMSTTRYTLTILGSLDDCPDTSSVRIRVRKKRNVFLPTAFTPNEDGQNDTFKPYCGIGVTKIHKMQVFDRWGEAIFSAENFLPNDPNVGWNGEFHGSPLPDDVFIYIMKVEFIDGEILDYWGEVYLLGAK